MKLSYSKGKFFLGLNAFYNNMMTKICKNEIKVSSCEISIECFNFV